MRTWNTDQSRSSSACPSHRNRTISRRSQSMRHQLNHHRSHHHNSKKARRSSTQESVIQWWTLTRLVTSHRHLSTLESVHTRTYNNLNIQIALSLIKSQHQLERKSTSGTQHHSLPHNNLSLQHTSGVLSTRYQSQRSKRRTIQSVT